MSTVTFPHASTVQDLSDLQARIETHLKTLSVEIGCRPVGSRANQRAQEYITRVLSLAGLEVELQEFEALDWELNSAQLYSNGQALVVRANPYTLGCDVSAPVIGVSTLAELDHAHIQGRIVIMHGELAREPIFPKNFRFVTNEQHRRIVELLEHGKPAAVIAVSPYDDIRTPIFNDGDFEIPSATVPSGAGAVLLRTPCQQASLRMDVTWRTGRGANVLGRHGSSAREKLIFCAHFDTQPGTPGAIDNAAGVAALLGLAETLGAQALPLHTEWVAFNGEDYYSSAGEIAYMDRGGISPQDTLLVVNMDGVGWRAGRNSVAFFNCSDIFVNAVMAHAAGMSRVEPWYQGDHFMFASAGIPTIAFSSDAIETIVDTIIHTGRDTIEQVEASKILQVVTLVTEIACGAKAWFRDSPVPAERTV